MSAEMLSTFTLDAYQFMWEHAGYSYRPVLETREQGTFRSALEFTRAEHVARARRLELEFLWEDDPEGTVTGEHPAWRCTLLHWGDVGADASVLASLGGIDAPEGDPERRVVEAELALEGGRPPSAR